MGTSSVEWLIWEALLREGLDPTRTERDTIIDDSISSLADGIVNDPAYQADATVNGVTTPLVVSPVSTISAKLKALPDTEIHIGDLVECYNQTWLVVELYYDKMGIINGTLWLCNKTINFQNFSPVIHTKYCVVDDGTYSKRSSDPDVYVMTNTYKIFISIDQQSDLLYVDKRLGLDVITSSDNQDILEVYKIIGIDRLSRNFGKGSHLMVLTVQRDVYDAAHDDIEHLICDVYKDEEPIEPTTDKYIRVVGRSNLRVGSTGRYGTEFIDGETVTTGVPEWSVDIPEGSKITYTVIENILNISVPLNENEIGTIVTITARDAQNIYTENEMKVKVIALG